MLGIINDDNTSVICVQFRLRKRSIPFALVVQPMIWVVNMREHSIKMVNMICIASTVPSEERL